MGSWSINFVTEEKPFGGGGGFWEEYIYWKSYRKNLRESLIAYLPHAGKKILWNWPS